MVFATRVLVFLLRCYCRYFDETFTGMLLVFSLLWLYMYLGIGQVSVYRTIGPTLFILFLPLYNVAMNFQNNFDPINLICKRALTFFSTNFLNFALFDPF